MADPDEVVLHRVRDGDSDAYAQLWRRHLPSAYAVANRYRGRASADDIVGEASLRVYERIRAGKGPTSNFRSYFLTAVKTVAIDWARAELRLVPTQPEDLDSNAEAVPPHNPTLRVDQDLIRAAFGRLSEREQLLLWRTAVEGTAPTVLATTLGQSAGAVRVAALRAREALRGTYLDAHADRAVQRANSDECRWVLSRLGRYVRGDLRTGQRVRIERHLKQCRHATVVLAELTEVNRALPSLLVPVVFVGGSASFTLFAAGGLTGSATGDASGPAPSAAGAGQATATVAGAAPASGALTKVAAIAAAGALSAALVTAPAAPTAPVGPALAGSDAAQHDSGRSPSAEPTDSTASVVSVTALAAAATPTPSADAPPVGVPLAPDPSDPAPGEAGQAPPATVDVPVQTPTTGTPSTTRDPVTPAAAPGRGSQSPTSTPTRGTPKPVSPTPAPPAPAAAPGLQGLSNAMDNVAHQPPQANGNALAALQNAADRLTDKQPRSRP